MESEPRLIRQIEEAGDQTWEPWFTMLAIYQLHHGGF